jgi:hypothetical protein
VVKIKHGRNHGAVIFCLLFLSCSHFFVTLQAEPVLFENRQKQLENFGTFLHAHGGGVLKDGDYYYWFGENRNYNGNDTFYAVSCYRSKDLRTWEFRNHVLMQSSDAELDFAKIERPKVIHNTSTGKYVMWMHKEYGDNYNEARAAVAWCDTVDGDYTYTGSFRPEGYMSRDCTLFVDNDGTGYFISAANDNKDLHVYELTADYLGVVSRVKKLWTSGWREAPCMFKRNGVYFIVTSGATGWSPNQAKYGYSTSIGGNWSGLQDLGDSTTYNTQSHYVLTINGSLETSYMYMGDRWARAWGDYTDNSLYVWLPLEFPTSTSMTMSDYDVISIDVETGELSGISSGDAWVKIDDDDASISYSAGWGTWEGNPGYNGTEHYNATTGEQATFSFTGIKARYYGFKRPDLGYANILVDGILQTSIDCYNSSNIYDVLLYETAELSHGSHTLTVRVAGTHNPANTEPTYPDEIIVDAFSSTSTSSSAGTSFSDLDPNAVYRIVNRNSSKVLTIGGADKNAVDAPIQQYSFANENYQKWQAETKPDGSVEMISVHSGKRFDVSGQSTNNGALIVQQNDSGNASQQWDLLDQETGYVTIKNSNSQKYIEINGESMDDDAQAVQYYDTGKGNQQWMFLEDSPSGTEAVFIEAESASAQGSFSPFTVMSGGALADGQYIIVPNGNGDQTAAPSTGISQYTFDLDVHSIVEVWLLTNSTGVNDNSFQIRMDSESYQWLSLQENPRWIWTGWARKDLASGTHTLSIAWREDGTSLDKICLRISPEPLTDFNATGRVDFQDFGLLASYWLSSDPTYDVTPSPGDGLVGMQELLLMATEWLD